MDNCCKNYFWTRNCRNRYGYKKTHFDLRTSLAWNNLKHYTLIWKNLGKIA